MAKLYGKNAAVDFAATNLMSFGKSFSRLSGQPLDKSEVWFNLEDLQAYALTDAAYVGQKVVYIDDANGVVTHYGIEVDGSLKELGSTPIGDNKSIVIAENGTISLKGVPGLDFVKRNEDGTAVTDEEGNEVKVNYQPLMTEAGLTWIVPSDTTAAEIEDLKNRATTLEAAVGNDESGLIKAVADLEANKADKSVVEGLVEKVGESSVEDQINAALEAADLDQYATNESLNEANEKIGKLETAVGNAESGLVKDVADLKANKADKSVVEGIDERVVDVEEAIEVLNGGVTVEGSVAKQINDAINTFATEVTDNGTIEKFAELVDYVAKHGGEAAEMGAAISDLEAEMIAAKALIGETSVDSQIKDAFAEANLDQYATNDDLTSATDRIADLEEAIGDAENGLVKDIAALVAADAGLSDRILAIEKDYLKAADKQELADLISDLDEAYKEADEDLAARILAIEEDYLKAADKQELADLISDLEVAYKKADKDLNDAILLKANQTDLEGAIDRIALLEQVDAEKNVIASVNETQFKIDENRQLSLINVEASKVSGLDAILEDYVEKEEGKRLLTEEEATKLEKLILDGDQVTVSGSVAAGNIVGLDEWITNRAGSLTGLSENNFTNALASKLNAIEANAQVNVIEAIKLAGQSEALAISNKTVEIPYATDALPGLVKLSSEIGVNSNNQLEVKSIDISKITQSEDVIFDCGGAAVRTYN